MATDVIEEAATQPLSDPLRRAIAESGLSLYSLATATGVDAGTLGRFVRRECGLKLATVDKLFAVLGLKVTVGSSGSGEPGPTLPTDALRAAIEASGLSAPKLSALSGVHAKAIRNFVGGVLGLELIPSADRIATTLGLRVVQGPRPTLAPPERPGDAARPILDAILAEIKARGLNLAELARNSGVRLAHAERLVVHQGNAKIGTADRLCEALGIGFIAKVGEPAAVPSVAIRKGIEASGLSMRRLGLLSGVVYQAIDGFRAGRVGLELKSAERLVAAMGIAASHGQVARPPDPPPPDDPSIPYVDGLRAATKATGLSVYALSKLSGLAQPVIARLLRGERNLRVDSIAKLAGTIGYIPAIAEPSPVAAADQVETQPTIVSWRGTRVELVVELDAIDSKATREVVTKLIEFMPNRPSKLDLEKKSGHGDAVNLLKRFADSGTRLAKAVRLPGQGKKGYWIEVEIAP
jgi:transcriptional regulator with XRE-family HTH domain